MKLFLHILNIFSLLVISFGLGIWNLGLGIFTAYAQPYAPINPNRIAYFGYSDYYYSTVYNAIRIDSVKTDSLFTIYKNYLTFGEDPEEMYGNCLNIYDTSWIGYQVVNKPNGDYIFFNRWLDSIMINTQALLNQSWTLCTFPDSSYFLATVTEISTESVLGQSDSVKTISLQKKSKTGVNTQDPFNSKQIKIGKNSGFIQTYFLHKFPLDTSVRILVGLTNPDIGVQNPTVKTIFNYNIGDIFHFSEGIKWTWSLKINEEMVKRKVIDKFFSASSDTVFYTYIDTIVYVQDSAGFIDTAWIILDTLNEVVPVNFTLFDTLLPYQSYLFDSSGNYYKYWSSVNQTSSDFNGRVKKIFGWQELIYSDSCFNQIHADGCEYVGHYYIDGCGQRFFPGNNSEIFNRGYWWGGFGGFICWNELRYFKKGSEEWGAPIVFPGITELKIEKAKFIISPNPFSEKAIFEIQGMRSYPTGFELVIYDLLGNTLVNLHSTGLSFEINRNGLNSGIYFFKLLGGEQLLNVGKLMIEAH